MSRQGVASMDELLAMMDPQVLDNLRTAVELGRWPNGDRLSSEQVGQCLQAIIAYEQRHLPETQRTGYIDTAGIGKSHCDDDQQPAPDAVQDLKWVHQACASDEGKGH